jgi:acetolactate decarboxylase
MKKFTYVFVGLIYVFLSFSQETSLYQFSTFSALSNGLYESSISLEKIKDFGDFGIGTYNSLDGELILYNGKFLRAKADSINHKQVEEVRIYEKTPFIELVQFKSDTAFTINKQLDLNLLDSIISAFVPTKNIMYAVRVEAKFNKLKCRSVSKQVKPYKKLVEAVKDQKIWKFESLNAVLIGFYMPDYMKDINVPGYHWHAISTDERFGGHLLDFECSEAKVEICFVHNFKLQLPSNTDFNNSTLKCSKQETDYIEKNK